MAAEKHSFYAAVVDCCKNPQDANSLVREFVANGQQLYSMHPLKDDDPLPENIAFQPATQDFVIVTVEAQTLAARERHNMSGALAQQRQMLAEQKKMHEEAVKENRDLISTMQRERYERAQMELGEVLGPLLTKANFSVSAITLATDKANNNFLLYLNDHARKHTVSEILHESKKAGIPHALLFEQFLTDNQLWKKAFPTGKSLQTAWKELQGARNTLVHQKPTLRRVQRILKDFVQEFTNDGLLEYAQGVCTIYNDVNDDDDD